MSRGKAESVAKKHNDAIIISADTIIALDGEIFGKPHTPERAKEFLEKLSGKTHSIFTGFTIINTSTKSSVSKSVETKVYFKKWSPQEIDWYVATQEPLDKGGGYAIQGLGALFIKRIKGDYFNIMGLPLFELTQTLQNKFGITFLD